MPCDIDPVGYARIVAALRYGNSALVGESVRGLSVLDLHISEVVGLCEFLA